MSLSFTIYIQDITIKAAFYFIGIMGSLGIVLNLFGILVFSRKTFASMSMGLYNIALALVNNCVIVINCLIFMPSFYGQDSFAWSQTSCILLNYLNRVTLHYASWLDMMIAIDRTVYILYSTRPFVSSFLLNKKYLSSIILGLLVCILAINGQIFEYKIVSEYENVTSQYNFTKFG